MKRTIKTILLFSLAIFMMTGVCGCMNNKLSTGHQKMMDYINQKYDDTFTFVSVYGGSPGSEIHKIWVSSEAYPDRLISVMGYEENGSLLFCDNYLSVKYETQTIELLHSIFDRYGKEVKILYQASNLACTKGGSNDTTFAEYIAERSSMIDFTAIISSDEKADQSIVEEIQKDIQNAGLCCSGKIYFSTNHPDLDSITQDNIYKQYSGKKEYDAYLYLYMTGTDSFETVRWEDNK